MKYLAQVKRFQTQLMFLTQADKKSNKNAIHDMNFIY